MDAILITGPTASGKSALAVKLAQKHGGEIINADSMQVYDALHMLTARPFEAEMGGIRHRLYGTVCVNEPYSTGHWLRSVVTEIEEVRARGKLPVCVGGTGLYFRALTGGLSDMPEIEPDIRDNLRERLKIEGASSLHEELMRKDPAMAARLEPTDGQRIVRALEVMAATGRSIADYRAQSGPEIIDPDRALKYVVAPDRAILHARINRRFETMLEEGAVEEVKALLKQDISEDMPAMKAIGVSQIALMLRGEMSRQDVIACTSAATRQYAKRQMTWFRNQMDSSWQRLGFGEEPTDFSV
jgi:tRNA dimethylallyltransferase